MTSTFSAVLLSAVFLLGGQYAFASDLEVPILERASDGFDTCPLGEVAGLKADGDGFLAVRSGPGTGYQKIDALMNGDRVWMFEQRGKWIGIAYGSDEIECSPVATDQALEKPGKKGWVHENWITIIAG